MGTDHTSVSDEGLMTAFIEQGDKQAYGRLYAKYFGPLSKYIGWLTSDQERGKDIAQNTFYRVYQNPAAFDATRKFSLWLYAIAKNMWKNDLRSRVTRSKHHNLSKQTVYSESIEITEDKSKLDKIHKALASLSPQHKEVFILKYSSNLTINEISEVCECSTGTVKSRLFYAIKKIRENIKTA